MSCFLHSGREYALNFKGGWNQMDGSCCAKKKKEHLKFISGLVVIFKLFLSPDSYIATISPPFYVFW